MQPVQHALFFRRQIRYHAVQEQRSLVEQALRRFHSLHHHAASQRMQACILIRRKLLAGEDDHRQLAQCRGIAQVFEDLKARHVRQLQIEHHAVELLFIQRAQRFLPARNDRDVDVVVTEQLADAQLLAGVVFHDQQPLAPRSRVILDPSQRSFDFLRRRRLGDEGKRPPRQTMLTVFIKCQHLHRNMPRGRILLQMIQDRPSQHVRQEYVERDRGWMILTRQLKRFRAPVRHQYLESLIVRQIAQHASIVRIILHNQQYGVVRLQVLAIVCNVLLRHFHDVHAGQMQRSSTRRLGLAFRRHSR